MPHVAHTDDDDALKLALHEGTNENPIFNQLERDILKRDVSWATDPMAPAPNEIQVPKQRVPKED